MTLIVFFMSISSQKFRKKKARSKTRLIVMNSTPLYFCQNPTQPQLNSTKHTLSWVRHENDFANPPITTTTPHKLNVNIISAVTDPILMKL